LSAGLSSLLNEASAYGAGGGRVGYLTPLPAAPNASSASTNASDTTKGDSLSLSDLAQSLKSMGLDLGGNSSGELSQSLDFNLQFGDEEIKGVSSKGSYDLHSQSLKVDLSFVSALSVTDAKTGEERKELFQFDFHLDASEVQVGTGDQKGAKEDILQFVRNALDSLSGMASGGSNLNGMALNSDELKKLAQGNEGKLLKGIGQIVQLMQNAGQSSGRSTGHSRHNHERAGYKSAGVSQIDDQNLTMSLNIQQVSAATLTASQAENTLLQSASGQ